MANEEFNIPSVTIKLTAETLKIHPRTVMRMIEDGRLEGKLVDTPRGKVWMITPVSIATMIVRKMDSGGKQYPRAKKKEET